jgi:hypothetical protein
LGGNQGVVSDRSFGTATHKFKSFQVVSVP